MNKREFVAMLNRSDLPDHARVMIAVDAEGNQFSYVDELDYYEVGELDDEVDHPVIVIWPV